MPMTGLDTPERPPHDEAEELLPWYATGQLNSDERALVERHLYSCAECRQQLAVERRLIDQFQTMTPEADSGWARLKARIEPPQSAATAPRPNFFADLKALITRPAVAALAAGQLAIVAVGGAFLSLSQPVYQALGSTPEPASANVIVMFRAEATEADMRDALKAAGASIVGGPTAADAYLIHVDPRRRQAALAKLQASHDVQLAEPVDGVGP
jgi:anti-sigma factor RsiW